jgi:ABC-type transport system involved in multi-copper enzyme maturation permease subunit
MKQKEILIGFLIGVVITLIGTYLFMAIFTGFMSMDDLYIIKEGGYLGKVLTLGAILNLIIFFILLQKNKDLMARGIILAMIFITIITLFL